MRGTRKALRSTGPHTQALVRGVEEELMRWLGGDDFVLNPDKESRYQFPGPAVAAKKIFVRLSAAHSDSSGGSRMTRGCVHCCVQYHNIVSFFLRHIHSYLR
jgi:hypothetical protein